MICSWLADVTVQLAGKAEYEQDEMMRLCAQCMCPGVEFANLLIFFALNP